MFELSKQFRFDSAHTLERKIETEASRRVHGHSYRAEVPVQGVPDKTSGMIIDLGFFENKLHDVRDALDHRLLDDVEGLGPATLENLTAWIWQQLSPDLKGLAKITVYRDSNGEDLPLSRPRERNMTKARWFYSPAARIPPFASPGRWRNSNTSETIGFDYGQRHRGIVGLIAAAKFVMRLARNSRNGKTNLAMIM